MNHFQRVELGERDVRLEQSRACVNILLHKLSNAFLTLIGVVAIDRLMLARGRMVSGGGVFISFVTTDHFATLMADHFATLRIHFSDYRPLSATLKWSLVWPTWQTTPTCNSRSASHMNFQFFYCDFFIILNQRYILLLHLFKLFKGWNLLKWASVCFYFFIALDTTGPLRFIWLYHSSKCAKKHHEMKIKLQWTKLDCERERERKMKGKDLNALNEANLSWRSTINLLVRPVITSSSTLSSFRLECVFGAILIWKLS